MPPTPASRKSALLVSLVTAAVIAALGAGWLLRQRAKAPPETTGSDSVIISPHFAAPANQGAMPSGPRSKFADEPAARERALIAAFNAALVGAGQPPADQQTPDLLAVLMVSRIAPVPPNPSTRDIDAAVARRQGNNEGILVASSVFLTPAQLAVYRSVLHTEVEAIEALRARASRG
jgi:hypothetical protein